ncbi:hypothetical protein RB195_014478 [Necator americanus]|uniref:Uncharacterized protein n=1 Tax=Necator americanus TaxID=51031 RepID=A0ABR1E087_NECAM
MKRVKIDTQLNLDKTLFMKNGWVSDSPFTLKGKKHPDTPAMYVYLCREINMLNDLNSELGTRKRAAWGAFKSIEDVVKRTKNIRLRAHLFNTTVLNVLTYASETWAFRKQDENTISVVERRIKRVMLGITRFTQLKKGIRSSYVTDQKRCRICQGKQS